MSLLVVIITFLEFIEWYGDKGDKEMTVEEPASNDEINNIIYKLPIAAYICIGISVYLLLLGIGKMGTEYTGSNTRYTVT